MGAVRLVDSAGFWVIWGWGAEGRLDQAQCRDLGGTQGMGIDRLIQTQSQIRQRGS